MFLFPVFFSSELPEITFTDFYSFSNELFSNYQTDFALRALYSEFDYWYLETILSNSFREGFDQAKLVKKRLLD